MEKTRYQERVDSGQLEPMTGLEWLLLGVIVDGIVDGNDVVTEADKAYFPEMMDEIENLYKDEPEKVAKFKELIEYKEPKSEENVQS